MTVTVGSRVPDVKVVAVENGATSEVMTGEYLGSGKVVLFGVPGAFTPTCSDYHLPGFVIRAEDLRAKGVDKIACIAVNDVFVMKAWAASQNISDEVVLLADGNGDFAKAAGLELDGSGFGMGLRNQRFAMVIENGAVRSVAVEPGGGLTVSSADSVLASL
ncbi:MAG: peroxiredoxin [Actinomycetota bacterium]|nr:peroxiredoxin [Actinomycetota bacterium]